MKFGIPEKSLNMIITALSSFDCIVKASIFGSRAMGNHKNGSDVDLVIYGSNITGEIVNKLRILLNEELPLPYYFDVVHYEALDSSGLRQHIDDNALVLYSLH